MVRATLAKPKRKLPDMSQWSDEQIAQFWETHDSADYLDEGEDVEVEIDIPADSRVISLRLETRDIESAKQLARRKGLPYTVLLRMWIKEKLAKSSES
jgi:predicted DNA binding CopG/RHH family protein